MTDEFPPPEVVVQQELAKRYQREIQQGLGAPIISEIFQGERFVAVGPRLFHSPKWKTFHDFLFFYVIHVLGIEWFQAEELKPTGDQHPLFLLHRKVTSWCQAQQTGDGQVKSAPMTGACTAYLRFAYHLYLLNHNGGLPDTLRSRLKNKDQFEGAQHELYVAATFIKAGFKIEFEDESDSSKSHCEFTVVHKHTQKKFSVEAKARNVTSTKIRSLFGKALAKEATYDRIIWIAINAPASDDESAKTVLQDALQELRQRESALRAGEKEAPPAYVIVSNQPYSYAQDSTEFAASAFAEGFKIPDFKMDQVFRSVHEMRLNREKHRELHDLMESMRLHDRIPITFDGQIETFAFNEHSARLQIGQIYEIPDSNGRTIKARLETACVNPAHKSAMGIYRTEDGRNVMVSCPLTDDEMEAYARHPETFFGVLEPYSGKNIEYPLELFDFIYRTYQKSTKEKLLEFMSNHSDILQLQNMSQAELAILYCERLVDGLVIERERKRRLLPSNPEEIR